MYKELLNKRILITGSSTGIGAGIAKTFAKYHTNLILHYNSHYDGVIETQQQVCRLGSQAEIIQSDFRKEESAQSFFNEAVACFSGIDILINNAGVVPKKNLNDTDLTLWKETFSINLHFPFLLSKLFANRLIDTEQPGAIVNISSIHGSQTCEHFGAYASSKAALNTLTQIQSIEWAKHHIRVNTIAPGVVEVDRNKSGLQDQQELWNPKILLGRYGTPNDIAELAVFLSSNAATWITGQVFTIDGGMTARGNFPIRNER
jgi:NAD(P)-dependent dehydrogenase (short-subunit alcohol dehydrogenase family)